MYPWCSLWCNFQANISMLSFYVGSSTSRLCSLCVYYSDLLFDPHSLILTFLSHWNPDFTSKLAFVYATLMKLLCTCIHELLCFVPLQKTSSLTITSDIGFIQIFASKLLGIGFYYTQTFHFPLGSTLLIPACFFSTLIFLSFWLLKLFLWQAVLSSNFST